MARTIGPDTPTPITAPNIDIPDIDLSVFDQFGDQKVKTAMQNFRLFATTTANAEAQKAYQKYKNNPIALANALSKLPGMFEDLPKSIQDEMRSRMDANAISLVTKAQANQQRAMAKENKARAKTNAVLDMSQITEDFFNVLRYETSPQEEKRPIDKQIYEAHRQQLAALTELTDAEGNPLFNESQRQKLLMPKEATVAGFKNFINRMESDQLKKWDEEHFQDKDAFMRATGIDEDTYESMETALTKRMKALADTKVRTIHGQAWYDQANLITEPTKLAIERAKSYDFTNDKDIDKLVDAAKEVTLGKYYDPTRRTSPNAFVQAYNVYADIINTISDNPSAEEQAKAVAGLAEATTRLKAVAKESNLDPKYTDSIMAAMQKALTDKMARQALIDSDFANRTTTQAMLQGINTSWTTPNMIQGIYQGRKEMGNISKTSLYNDAVTRANELATQRYNNDLSAAMAIYLTGDMAAFRQACAQADRNFDKNRASFIVRSDNEWQRLENELAQGHPAMIQYMGRTLEFKGFDNNGAIFVEKH